jgi:peptide methionine sulfoxide reductase MsrB
MKSDKEKEKQGIHSQRLGMNPFFYYGNSWVDETGWVSYNNSQKVKSIGRRGV